MQKPKVGEVWFPSISYFGQADRGLPSMT